MLKTCSYQVTAQALGQRRKLGILLVTPKKMKDIKTGEQIHRYIDLRKKRKIRQPTYESFCYRQKQMNIILWFD